MKTRFCLLLMILITHFSKVAGQSAYLVRGVVADSAGASLSGATVRLYMNRDTLATISQMDGSFAIKGLKFPHFGISVSLIGYRSAVRMIMAGNQRIVTLDTFHLTTDFLALDTATVTSIAPIVLKGDTVEYRTGAYKTEEGDRVEDLLKKLPGLTVDNTGQITAQGKKITKVTVNGKDFFGDDILIATQNLPADIIRNIQVIQDYGPESILTGIKSGQPVPILNINTAEDKSAGNIGQLTAGPGTDERYQGAGFANQFTKEKRLGIAGSASNNGVGADVNNQQALRVNYGDRWSDKLAGNGNFGYGHSTNISTGNSLQQSFLSTGTTLNNTTNAAIGQSSSRNLQYTLTYFPNNTNTVTLNGKSGHSNSMSANTNDFTIDQSDSLDKKITTGHSIAKANNLFSVNGASLLFVHQFKKSRRILSLNTYLDETDNSQDNNILNNTSIAVNDSQAVNTPLHQYISNDNRLINSNIKLTYIEPIGKTMQILLNMGTTNHRNKSLRSVYAVDSISGAYSIDDSLSDLYNYSQNTRSAGLSLSGTRKLLDFTLGLSVQPITLSGSSMSKNFPVNYNVLAIIPAANLTFRFTRTSTLNLTYTTASGLPGLSQLRPVTDYSNPQYPVTGNPKLKPSYIHSINLGLNCINPGSGAFFFVNLSGNETQNNIVANVISYPPTLSPLTPSVIQETRYLNSNGIFLLNSSYSYSRLFLKRKLVLSLSGGLGYNNNVSFNNYVRSVNANWVFSQGAEATFSILERMDLSLNANYSSNRTVSSNSFQNNTSVNSMIFGVNAKNYFLSHYLISYELVKTINSGYSSTVANNPTILNIFLERWFKKNKMTSLKLLCYNLFNQNITIAHDVSGNTITDSRTNQIGRYFMLIGNIRLNKFFTNKKAQ